MVRDDDVRESITGERMGNIVRKAHEKLIKKESIADMITCPKDFKGIYSERKRAIVK